MGRRGAVEVITLTLPFPPKELSPNARKPWQVKATYVKAYRHECKIEALKVMRAQSSEGWLTLPGMVDVTITFILKGKTRRDWDNLLASFKAGIDGIVDAGLMPDDDVRSWSPTLRYEQGNKAGVRVELRTGD